MSEANPVEAIRLKLGLKPEEFARALRVSSGHGADLRSGRRKPSLPIASRLDGLIGEARFLPQALAEKMNGRAA
ncbi:MAG: hypothetical protein WC718_01225 [Phycisphaerales bacterium]|jgi:DNA-binding transcriptional regulator YiaG